MNKNVIIAILIVIIVAAGAAIFLGHSSGGKVETQINFLNKGTIQNGEQVTFELKDANGNPIAGETVKLTYNTNEKYSVVTDNDGKGHLFISGEDDGKYDIVADYAGNDKYSPCTAKTTINITADAPDNEATQTSGNSVANTDDNNNNGGGNGSNPNSGSNRYFIPQYEIWVEDGVVVDGPIGIGMSLDDWMATYTPENPHFDDPDDPLNPIYDPDNPYPGDVDSNGTN